MKPRTKLQKEVFALAECMPPIRVKHKDWAFERLLDHIGYSTTKGVVRCLSCGESFQGNGRKKQSCRHCSRNLRVITTRKRALTQESYMIILDVVEGFQVVRYFDIYCYQKTGMEPNFSILERFQKWYKDGETTHYGQYVGMGACWQGCMEIREARSYYYNHMYNPILNNIYPERKILKEFKMYGIRNRRDYNLPLEFLLEDLKYDRRAETLIKNNQFSLLSAYLSTGRSSCVNRYWASVRIAIRHKYKINDAMSWLDHLIMLNEIGKDLRNPKFICPPNFKKSHRELSIIIEKKKAKELENDLRLKNLEYQKAKSQFLGLQFRKGDIEVKVIESVEEFKEEGNEMKHCVFGMRYYDKKESLIFSARVKGKRMETVEVDLKQMKVVQARGKNNVKTDYSDEIVQLVNSNIKEIERRVKAG